MAPPSMKKNRELRSEVAAQLRSIINQLDHFEAYLNGIQRENLNKNVVTELESRLTRVETFYTRFEELILKLDALANDESASEFESINDFGDRFFRLLSVAKQFIVDFHHLQPRQVGTVDFGQGVNCDANFINNNFQNTQIKLPVINLPHFGGEFTTWVGYKDAFVALVHNNQSISNIQKFLYLQSTLKGNAYKVIDNIIPSNDNYALAWGLLVERFDNKKLIINSYVQAIFNLKTVTKESATSLRELTDNLNKNLRALKNLGQPVDSWDALVLHIVLNKLDSSTKLAFAEYKIKGELPTIADLTEFLNLRCIILETQTTKDSNKDATVKSSQKLVKRELCHVGQNGSNQDFNNRTCPLCQDSHALYSCEAFKALPISSRISEVKRLRLCINCFRSNHFARQCKSSSCTKCHKRHNTMLHLESQTVSNSNNLATCQENPDIASNSLSEESAPEMSTAPTSPTQVVTNNCSAQSIIASQVLLSTAILFIKDRNGKFNQCRALLDSGSQSSIITQELCERLGLQKIPINSTIIGINHAVSNIKHQSNIVIKSCISNFESQLQCLVLPQITDSLPAASFDKALLNIPQDIQLADPNFNTVGPTDILLGSNIFWQLLCSDQIKLGNNKPVLQQTLLGWIIAGNVPHIRTQCNFTSVSNFVDSNSFERQIEKFWEVESLPFEAGKSKFENSCETHFKQTYARNPDGRFVVKIPFKDNLDQLGESRQQALNRFLLLERKLSKNQDLKNEYVKFMDEYEQLGHMSKIDDDNLHHNPHSYYIPHHPVFKETSSTTKLRVVFDASMKTSTGVSLNQTQQVGPTIQNNLFSILLRFRTYEIVVKADIEKMYRQVLVHQDDRAYQRIFWRSNPLEAINVYELNTVTYGTSSAPFLAIRSLSQVAIDNQDMHPKISEIIKSNFYVDDLISGSNTVDDAAETHKLLSEILLAAGFHLRKWLSNNPNVLKQFQSVEHSETSKTVQFGDSNESRTLGVCWDAHLDNIEYSIKQPKRTKSILTKRVILSTLSQIFDPLGLLSPVIIIGKILIQQLWKDGLGWDDPVPHELHNQWLKFCAELPKLSDFAIPRFVLVPELASIDIHGFADASETAYGACIYVRTIDKFGQICTKLLCSKSRVSPLKVVTIPRLELCAAVLLTQLMEQTLLALNMTIGDDNLHLWSDSTIVIAWLNTSSHSLKTFVGNRVAFIQDKFDIKCWKHVKSEDNPADLISRGMYPSNLLESDLWFNGPNWLCTDKAEWPIKNTNSEVEILELKKVKVLFLQGNVASLFTKYSSIWKLQRIIAYMRRFMYNCQCVKKKLPRKFGPLTASEVDDSLMTLVKICQSECFKNEISDLRNSKKKQKISKIQALSPFLDDQNILRVGGRLNNSEFSEDKKHPILLPSNHPITYFLMQIEHNKLMHCGPQQLLAQIREKYWPLRGRDVARKVVHTCVRCFRANPKPMKHIMGNLPKDRLQHSFPFSHVGVDYAGPILIKDRILRNSKLIKAYICLFICFTSKAIHLELVTELSTDAFIAVLRRFISRRGKPNTFSSDNGTNFVGANREIQELYSFLQNSTHEIVDVLSKEGITWEFIPPRSPHMGGLWEAGIKSTKNHLRRVLGDTRLNFEDFYTVLTQIEAVLNSKPLTPMSNDPNDYLPLTPGHFLIGRPLVSLPSPTLSHIQENRLSFFQRQQLIVEHFWKRWQVEYVPELQRKTKWSENCPDLLKIDSLVLIQDDTSPPFKWPLGRVVKLFPGKDNVVRVVQIRIANGTLIKRSVQRVCILPIYD